MSSSVYIMFKEEKIIDPPAWQNAIKNEGFDLELSKDLNMNGSDGFLPGKYKGQKAGFEYYISKKFKIEECFSENLHQKIRDNLEDRDTFVELVFYSELIDVAATAIAGAVLCKLTDGIIYDDGEDQIVTAAQAIEWAKRIEDDVKEELNLQ